MASITESYMAHYSQISDLLIHHPYEKEKLFEKLMN